MHALVFVGDGKLEYRDEALPSPKEDEVLVKVAACGICGSDMHVFHGHTDRKPPLIMGHEAAGWIESGPRKGERVAINPLVSCMRCTACLDGQSQLCKFRRNISVPPLPGAFADFVCVPERNVLSIADSLDFTAAALTEPLAVSYHAVNLGERLLRRPLFTSHVLIIGGGPIGLGCAIVLQARGVKNVTIAENNASRRDYLKKMGFANVFASQVLEEARDAPFEFVIDAVGAEGTRSLASAVTRPGGAIVHLGLLPGSKGLDVRRITLLEIAFSGSFCYTNNEYKDVLELITEGRLGDFGWIETRSMRDGFQAFLDIDAGTTASPKTVLLNA